MKKAYIFLTIIILVLTSCATSKLSVPTTSAKIVWDSSTEYSAQTSFAVDELKMAFSKSFISYDEENPVWVIELAGLDSSLGEQAYSINVTGNKITIIGGDSRGLMYGSLEVAEHIRMYRDIAKVVPSEGRPFTLNRGIKFDIPLDMRTPSYGDAGTSARENIDDVWDIEFWHEYLDELARNRITVLSIWNLNPFPSMVKVPEYPDVALDDVLRTKVELADTYKKNATDMVRPENYNNYEVVKEMTIDEKIEFWQEVMQYAKDRGIDFCIFTWNIYTFGENGKYGITASMDNPITADYYRASVREMIKTYPLLKGIGVTAGENMGLDIGAEEVEKWLLSTFGAGIIDGLKNEDRDFTFYHRLHYSDYETVQKVWGDFPYKVQCTNASSRAHVLSYPLPQEIDENLLLLPEGKTLRYEYRIEDNYHLKFGDASYVREYVKNTLSDTRVDGFFMGVDGYITAREVTALKPQSPRELYIKQHWIEYFLFSRLSYDVNLSDERIEAVLSERYGFRDGTLMFNLLSEAGKAIPLQNQLLWFGSDTYCREVDFNDSGYYGINNAIKNNASLLEAKVLSIVETCNNYEDGIPTPEGYRSAFDIAEAQKTHALNALELIQELKKQKKVKEAADEFELFLEDQEAMAYLGLYYSNKNYATLYLRLYNNLQDKSYHDKAVECAKDSAFYYGRFAKVYSSRFTPETLGRVGKLDVNDVLTFVQKDISLVENWKIRPLRGNK